MLIGLENKLCKKQKRNKCHKSKNKLYWSMNNAQKKD